jgi:hydroxyethylthiazole kinase-like uncharacterized protein yjeF
VSAPVEVNAETLRGWPLPSPTSSEKHSRGVALVVAGGTETPGAALLAAEAALRAGCGKVRIATVSSVAAALAVQLPEARVYGFDSTPSQNLSADAAPEIADLAAEADATLIGSGFTDPADAEALVTALLPALRGPVVLDALASAYVDTHRDLAEVEAPCVLALNPSEIAQVLGLDVATAQHDPAAAAGRLARESGAVVLLGGESKLVALPGGPDYLVTAGGPGLATAGSGDVQAGLVVGLLARGAEPAQAAVWAAWLHGAAGDRLADRAGAFGLLARELAAEVPSLLDDVAPTKSGRPR